MKERITRKTMNNENEALEIEIVQPEDITALSISNMATQIYSIAESLKAKTPSVDRSDLKEFKQPIESIQNTIKAYKKLKADEVTAYLYPLDTAISAFSEQYRLSLDVVKDTERVAREARVAKLLEKYGQDKFNRMLKVDASIVNINITQKRLDEVSDFVDNYEEKKPEPQQTSQTTGAQTPQTKLEKIITFLTVNGYTFHIDSDEKGLHVDL